MHVALLAGLAMLVQDVFEESRTVAASRGRSVITGLLDAGMWLAWFLSSSIAIKSEALHGWNAQTVQIVAFVTVANVIGSSGGVVLGRRFVKEA